MPVRAILLDWESAELYIDGLYLKFLNDATIIYDIAGTIVYASSLNELNRNLNDQET